jgi:hypothetical protein
LHFLIDGNVIKGDVYAVPCPNIFNEPCHSRGLISTQFFLVAVLCLKACKTLAVSLLCDLFADSSRRPCHTLQYITAQVAPYNIMWTFST